MIRRFAFIAVIVSSVVCIGYIGNYDVSCGEYLWINQDSAVLFHDQYLFFTARNQYNPWRTYDAKVYAIDTSDMTCKTFSNPSLSLPSHGESSTCLTSALVTTKTADYVGYYEWVDASDHIKFYGGGESLKDDKDDEFYYAYVKTKYNSAMSAQLEAFTKVNDNSKSGIMARESLLGKDKYAAILLNDHAKDFNNYKRHQYDRDAKKEDEIENDDAIGLWIRVAMVDGTPKSYKSWNGIDFDYYYDDKFEEVSLSTEYYFGIATNAEDSDNTKYSIATWAHIQIDGYVYDYSQTNYFVPVTADYSAQPFFIVPQQSRIVRAESDYSDFVNQNQWYSDELLHPIHTAATVTKGSKCAWYFFDYDAMAYATLETSTTTHSYSGVYSYTLPEAVAIGMAVGDSKNSRVFLALLDDSFVTINAGQFMLTYTWDVTIVADFFIIKDYLFDILAYESRVVIHYGPIIIGYEVDLNDPSIVNPIDLYFGTSGTPSSITVDNAWRGTVEGQAPAGIFASQLNPNEDEILIQMSTTEDVGSVGSFSVSTTYSTVYQRGNVNSDRNKGYFVKPIFSDNIAYGYAHQNYTIYEYSLYDCSGYSNCSAVMDDPLYCGWCVPDMKVVAFNETCSSDTIFHYARRLGCPSLTSISPEYIPAGIGYNITLSGALYADEVAGLECMFDGFAGTLVSVTNDSITCTTPSLSVGIHNVTVERGGVNFTSEIVKLSAFECKTLLTCSECVTVSGCGWRYDNVTCEGFLGSSSDFAVNSDMCPSIGATKPSGILVGTADEKIDVTVTPLHEPDDGSGINCTFVDTTTGYMNITNGKFINASLLQCDAPYLPGGSLDTTFEVRIVFLSYGKNYTEDYGSFLLFSCGNSFTCDECVDPVLKPGCYWCFEDSLCTSGVSCSPNYRSGTVCPTVTTTTPVNSYYGEKTMVSVIGDNLLDVSTYYAQLNTSSSSTNLVAAFVNSTSVIVSDLESSSADTGIITLFLNTTGPQYVGRYSNYNFYDCAGPTSCQSCVTGYDRCGWCYNTGCVYEGAGCSTTMFNSSCPVIYSITPDVGHKDVVTVSNITGSYFPPGFVYKAHAHDDASGIDANGTACTYVNSTFLTCPMPSPGVGGEADVYLFIDDQYFLKDSTITFSYFRCGEITSCDTCLQLPKCSYCHFGQCVEATEVNVTCDNGTYIEYCPVLSSFDPISVNTAGGINVTVNGTFNLPYAYSYEMDVICYFGSTYTVGEVVGNNSVMCYNIPAYGSTFASAPYFEDVKFEVSINSIQLFNTTYRYFDCSAAELQICSSCNDVLKTSTECGYCFSEWKCSEQNDCSTSASYLASSCPTIASGTTNYASAYTQTSATFTGTNFPSYTSNVICNYTVNTTSATVLSPTQVSCQTPLNIGQNSLLESVSVTLYVDGKQYIETPYGFEVLSCNANPSDDCSECTYRESRCGWCNNIGNVSFACTTQYGCSVALWSQTDAVCPSVDSLSAQVFYVGANEKVHFTATKLFNTTDLRCRFSALVSTFEMETIATVSNSTTGWCPIPDWPLPSGLPEAITFTIQYQNRSFADSYSSTLTMVPLPKDAGGISPWVLGGFGVGFGGVILFFLILIIIIVIVFVIIIIIIVVYFSRRGKRKLKKPNFKEVTFGADDKQKYNPTSKSTRVLRYMEDIMLDYEDTDFLNEIIKHVLPEEVDLFTKHLIYVLLPLGHSKALGVIIAFFNMELQKSSNEQTLFRVNSITTKMFARYARIVGAEFLWTALAYFVDEIIYKYAQNEKANKDDVAMTASSMEIDPSKVAEGEADFLAANTYQLLLTLSNLYRRFARLANQFPPQLGFFLRLVFEEVRIKYPGAEYKSVGGFVFLRWICPALFSPHAFGVAAKPPGAEAGRMLVLIAKTVQNISNESYPGRKEDFMGKVDEFIKANIPVSHKFIDSILDLPVETIEEIDERCAHVEVPKNAYMNSLVWFHNFLLTKPDFIDAFPDLQALLGKYAEPIM